MQSSGLAMVKSNPTGNAQFERSDEFDIHRGIGDRHRLLERTPGSGRCGGGDREDGDHPLGVVALAGRGHVATGEEVPPGL